MPGMDGTGPLGQGSMTGRGLGPCGTAGIRTPAQYQMQTPWFNRMRGFFGGASRFGGAGCGMGRRGMGRGRRRFFR